MIDFLLSLLLILVLFYVRKLPQARIFMKVELQYKTWPREARQRPRSCIKLLSYCITKF